MADLDDFVMTIDENDEVPNLEVVEQESEAERKHSKNKAGKKIDKKSKGRGKNKSNNVDQEEKDMNADFLVDLDADGLDSVPKTMDFALARAALKIRKNPNQFSTLDEKIAAKRKSMKSSGESFDKRRKLSTEAESEDEEDSNVEEEENDNKDIESEDDNEDGSNKSEESGSEESSEESMSESEDDEDSETDEEEREKRKAYFAPESEAAAGDIPESFTQMNLSRPIMKGLTLLGFVQPTPIQGRTIPIALLGKDICGGAVTGSGKTGAFMVPILERLLYRPKKVQVTRVVVLCPTRELAIQCHNVATKLASFTDIRLCLCTGGLSLKQQEIELKSRPDIVIATPGRLIDHVRNSQSFSMDNIEILVMDEADRMLEDGFTDELNEIVEYCPKQRQTMLFSATMTSSVDELIRLSLRRPVRIQIDPPKTAAKRLIQEFIRIRQNREDDRGAILVSLCKKHYKRKCIVFFRSKAAAHQMKIVFGLLGLKAGELHGNLSQEQRMDSLEKFRDGLVDYLMATDLAARGLDIRGVDTVINYNMPTNLSQYLHRIGRTARAGRSGRAVTMAGESDRKILKMAIKNAPKEQIRQRVVDTEVIIKYKTKLDGFVTKLKEILEEEKQERQLRDAEMKLKKAENLIKHRDEIHSRPKRTWFQTAKDKSAAKQRGRESFKQNVSL
ncbi:nucleolar DEAD-box protein required for synthesis of 60S ribosomal subunit [Mycoemilia scoparia]|uniref:ATP-dependent RNA helicase DRS1 n=1 Tax=Mycoemilia scoparia TaxID=417184 RepID=A0A9W8ABP6_9FUNG|nr:nucleolar DEAD-box protein required for synthesis of 60S ribosomal subunit [Mycoemilia scoparia]